MSLVAKTMEKEGTFLRLLRQPRLESGFAATSAAGIFASMCCIFTLVPNEAVMGPVQRIFYFHVGAAIASYAAIAILLFSSALYLADRSRGWDELADASAF